MWEGNPAGTTDCDTTQAAQGLRAGLLLPDWKEVMTVVTNFGTPLWERLCAGELYVGDWMPDLGRFL